MICCTKVHILTLREEPQEAVGHKKHMLFRGIFFFLACPLSVCSRHTLATFWQARCRKKKIEQAALLDCVCICVFVCSLCVCLCVHTLVCVKYTTD
jgi:hypothetical protein